VTIQHTVVFRLRHLPGSPQETAFLEHSARVLASIPGVEGFTVDRQVSAKSEFAWRFSMSFRDRAAYEAYNANPDHVSFVQERWIPEVAAFQELDFVELGADAHDGESSDR
jgi:hypothetical protein